MKIWLVGLAAMAVAVAGPAFGQADDQGGCPLQGGSTGVCGKALEGPGKDGCKLPGADHAAMKPGMPNMPERHEQMLKQFDKDGDGKLSDEERAAMKQARMDRHQKMIKKFDKDGDGKLSDEERAAMEQAMRERHQNMVKQFDKDGDGKLSDEERAAMRQTQTEKHQQMVKQFDKDGDGKLTDEERAAMRDAMEAQFDAGAPAAKQ